MPRGICKLCLKEAELRNSHYLPQAAYAANRADSLRNPNPVALLGTRAIQTSDQLRAPTYCGDCEDLLNRNGERWVLAHLSTGYKEDFPLQEEIIRATPTMVGDNIELYEGRKLPAFDMDQLIYFGLSVFWRGASREWKSTKGLPTPPVDLGEYYEPIRKFLLGGPYPDHVYMTVLIHNLKPVVNAVLPVHTGVSGYGDFYWFYCNGLGYMLFLGEHTPADQRKLCAHHGTNGPVIVDGAFGALLHQYLRDGMQHLKMSPSVEKLAKGLRE